MSTKKRYFVRHKKAFVESSTKAKILLISDSSIILFASNEGDNNEYSNILFDIEYEDSPTISYYEGDNKINDVVPEKIFHPIGDGNAIMIPLVGTTAKIYKIDEAIKLNVENFPEALKDIV